MVNFREEPRNIGFNERAVVGKVACVRLKYSDFFNEKKKQEAAKYFFFSAEWCLRGALFAWDKRSASGDYAIGRLSWTETTSLMIGRKLVLPLIDRSMC